METIFFFGQSYFAAGRNHYWDLEKTVFKGRAYSCYWTTDFLASGNHFFSSIFKRLLPIRSKIRFYWTEKLFPFESVSEKIEKKNRKVPGSNATRRSADLEIQPRYEVPGDPRVEYVKTQWLTIGWVRLPLDNAPKLTVGQPNSS